MVVWDGDELIIIISEPDLYSFVDLRKPIIDFQNDCVFNLDVCVG